MEELLLIAKNILDVNPLACLTGTMMLKLRGIDLGREPHDIDILIRDHAPCIIIPSDMKMEEIGRASDDSGIKYRFKDIVIDVLSDGEEPELVNGIRCGTLDGLMRAKYLYSRQNNEASQKHHDDLVNMGFVFPVISDVFELPY